MKVFYAVFLAAFFGGGWTSFTAYGIVVLAFTQARLGPVAAFPETSIIFSLIRRSLILKQRVDFARIGSVFLTLIGVP